MTWSRGIDRFKCPGIKQLGDTAVQEAYTLRRAIDVEEAE